MLKIDVVSYPHLGSLAFISFTGFLGSNVLTSGAWLIRSNEVAMVMVVDVLVGVVFFSDATSFISAASLPTVRNSRGFSSPNYLFPRSLGLLPIRQSE
jgi:hypothetical protein